MPTTIVDIARELNLSHTTVSRVLNGHKNAFISEATRQRVQEAARAMGYRPHRAARALATGRNGQVSLIMHRISQAHDARIIRHITATMRETNYQTLITSADLDTGSGVLTQENVDQTLEGVDGCFAFECVPYLISLLGEYPPTRPPLVGMGGVHYSSPAAPHLDYVGMDLSQGAEEAVRHLIAIGCRRIALLGGRSILGDERWSSYTRVLEEAGYPQEIIPAPTLQPNEAWEALRDYIDTHGCPDGIFCFNDVVALGAYRALRERGMRIPEDVALIGFDGIEDTEYLDCPISTLSLPVEEMCTRAWQFLRARIAEASLPPQQTLLQYQLVVRASSRR